MPKKKIKKIPIKKEKYDILKKVAIKLFGKMADRTSENFILLKHSLITADAKILYRTYQSLMFLFSFITFIFTFILTLIFSIYFNLNIVFAIIGLIIMPSFFASITFFLIYVYPTTVTKSRKRDIEANLPFALTHMTAVAESGAPPLTIFKILGQFKEYGEISKEFEKISRNVEIFGLDEITALRESILKCPSPDFKDVLEGMLTTIQTGGSLKSYLIEESGKAMFEYTVRREKYNQLLSTYADVYTALLIAAPMIFIVVLSTLNILGADLYGMSIQELMIYGIAGLAFLNVIFLTFLHATQPKM
jgi:flagellar protein FlaJ